MTALHISWTGPTKVIAVEAEERGRWCFGCRRHVRYILRLHASIEPSYYEPTWEASCPNGCGDRASGGFWYVHWNGGEE
jgi:hypothetical protein